MYSNDLYFTSLTVIEVTLLQFGEHWMTTWQSEYFCFIKISSMMQPHVGHISWSQVILDKNNKMAVGWEKSSLAGQTLICEKWLI